jgi:hypothetical protein
MVHRSTGVLRLAMLAWTSFITHGCTPPDCDHWDCGTCGGPCCTVDVIFPSLNASGLSHRLATVLRDGGPDGLFLTSGPHNDVTCPFDYTLVPTSYDPANPQEPKFPPKCVVVMDHETDGKKMGIHLKDQVNFKVYADEEARPAIYPKGAHLRGFAASWGSDPLHQCDWGQNWKTLATAIRALNVPFAEVERRGCDIVPGEPHPAAAASGVSPESTPAHGGAPSRGTGSDGLIVILIAPLFILAGLRLAAVLQGGRLHG